MDDSNLNNSAPSNEQRVSVQCLLGECVLRLQEYESLLKRVLPYVAVSGQPADLSTALAATTTSFRNKMLGSLVGTLTETFLAPSSIDDEDICHRPSSGGTGWVEYRTQVVLEAERYHEVKTALKQLVTLRNELIHHFVEKFDLSTPEGCVDAEAFLQHSYKNIEVHLIMLRGWTKALVRAHTKMASVLQESAFQDFVDGIDFDGSVDWRRSGIVQGLREAEEHLAKQGWTNLNEAIVWMAQNASNHAPKRYNCSSWRQVLHESKQFQVRKRTLAESDSKTNQQIASVWYRSRGPTSKN